MVKKWSLQFYVSNHSVTLREFFYKPNSFFSFLHKYKGRPDQCSYDHVTSNVLHVQETEWQQIVTSRAISWWMRKKRERDRVDTRQRDISRCLGIFCVMSLVVISSLWYFMCVFVLYVCSAAARWYCCCCCFVFQSLTNNCSRCHPSSLAFHTALLMSQWSRASD